MASFRHVSSSVNPNQRLYVAVIGRAAQDMKLEKSDEWGKDLNVIKRDAAKWVLDRSGTFEVYLRCANCEHLRSKIKSLARETLRELEMGKFCYEGTKK